MSKSMRITGHVSRANDSLSFKEMLNCIYSCIAVPCSFNLLNTSDDII